MLHAFIAEIRAVHYLLFYPAAKSFYAISHTTEDGTWQESYSEHRLKQHKLRTFSVSSISVILTATLVSNYILSFVF